MLIAGSLIRNDSACRQIVHDDPYRLCWGFHWVCRMLSKLQSASETSFRRGVQPLTHGEHCRQIALHHLMCGTLAGRTPCRSTSSCGESFGRLLRLWRPCTPATQSFVCNSLSASGMTGRGIAGLHASGASMQRSQQCSKLWMSPSGPLQTWSRHSWCWRACSSLCR